MCSIYREYYDYDKPVGTYKIINNFLLIIKCNEKSKPIDFVHCTMICSVLLHLVFYDFIKTFAL